MFYKRIKKTAIMHFDTLLSLCLTLEFAVKLYCPCPKKSVSIAFFYWPSTDMAREPPGKRGFVFVKDGRQHHQGNVFFLDSFEKFFYFLKFSRYVF